MANLPQKIIVGLIGFVALAASGVTLAVTADGCLPKEAYLTRHAEKITGQKDPHLSELGHRQAQALADRLKANVIDGLFATDYRRTQQTLAPLAQQKGLTIQSYSNEVDLVKALKTHYCGKIVVVAGHSNTIPVLLMSLGVPIQVQVGGQVFPHKPLVYLGENDYGTLFQVVPQAKGPAKLTILSLLER